MNPSTYSNFLHACQIGNLEQVLESLCCQSAEEKLELIRYDNGAGFHVAAINGHAAIVKLIINTDLSLNPDEIPEEIWLSWALNRHGESFKLAVKNHQYDVVNILLEQTLFESDLIKLILDDSNLILILWSSPGREYLFEIFNIACSLHTEKVPELLQLLPGFSEEISALTATRLPYLNLFFDPLGSACYWNHLETMHLLWKLLSHKDQHRVISNKFTSYFIDAAKKGHAEILSQLIEWVDSPEFKIALAKSFDYGAFIYAADSGNLPSVKIIFKLLPKSMQDEALTASNYAAYRLASKKNSHEIIKYLENNSDEHTIEKMKIAVTQGPMPSKQER